MNVLEMYLFTVDNIPLFTDCQEMYQIQFQNCAVNYRKRNILCIDLNLDLKKYQSIKKGINDDTLCLLIQTVSLIMA